MVPVRDGGAAFLRSLEAIRALAPAPLETIVVCDGCRDDSAEAARAAGCRVIEIGSPRGPAAARNEGARAAGGELLLFLDADVVAPPDIVGRLALRFGEDPGLDALIGSYDDAPADPEFLSQYRNLLHHYVHQTSSHRAATFWGACGAIRREVFLGSGGFDESYREPSIEDIELGGRLRQRGHRILLDPSLQVKHLKRWRAWQLVETDFRRRALPWTRLILRQRQLPDDLNLRLAARLTTAALFGALAAAVASAWRPALAPLVFALLTVALGLNAGFYRFLAAKRGTGFALRALPWHWLYFLYSGTAFAIGIAEQLLGALRNPVSRGA